MNAQSLIASLSNATAYTTANIVASKDTVVNTYTATYPKHLSEAQEASKAAIAAYLTK